ncbi:Bifunctional epoxide hydrolase 2 [Holothuria leucospilota]|uniref:Bifunctional epoxide hydrolase 2 n=1 Tax=Holothuria leucospilota TaxID=206669 RepID=A0A9Q1BJN1_HOLLE|nr:Bifunctional epoxide hydrolase 2 [Holothuria leucospilota]
MTMKKAVIFDLYGVIFRRPQGGITKYIQELKLPEFFLENAFAHAEQPGDAFFQLEKGDISVTQFLDRFEKQCFSYANSNEIKLPSAFSAQNLYFNFSQTIPDEEMLNAVAILKNKGLKICLLTNNFLDDTSYRGTLAVKFLPLRFLFDNIVESCHFGVRKPDPKIFFEACRKLDVIPEQTVFLDDLSENVKSARKLGMSTILVKNSKQALSELKKITGIDVLQRAVPVSCQPGQISECSIITKDGVKLHYFEVGHGPPVILLHGYPFGWYCWRRQIPALAMNGYRVIAIEMKGYGESSCPPEKSEYSLEKLTRDVISFLDSLGISQATFIGHGWGGHVAWSLALHYPERTFAVGSFNTPASPSDGSSNPFGHWRTNSGNLDHVMYFQEYEEKREAELEQDLKRFLHVVTRAYHWENKSSVNIKTSVRNGGLLEEAAKIDSPMDTLFDDEELNYLIQRIRKSGLRGMLNYFKNHEDNKKWHLKVIGRKIQCPALMLTASQDQFCPPGCSNHMELWISKLSRASLDCGHWPMLEKPAESNKLLIDWLNNVHAKASPLTSLL